MIRVTQRTPVKGKSHELTNLDFPSGPTYYLMGFDVDFFTPIFVIARITGWSAHINEQLKDNRLIRPLSKYTGSVHRKVQPIDKR